MTGFIKPRLSSVLKSVAHIHVGSCIISTKEHARFLFFAYT